MTHIKNKRQRIIIYLSMALLFITGFSSMAYAWPALTSSRWKNMTVPQLQSLLKHRDVNARTESGWHPGATALIHAVRAGASLQILELLLESGADIEAETEQNYTALLFALWGERELQPAKFLIERGANIHARNMNKATSLMIALWEKQELPQTVPLLLDLGVDIHAVDEFGATALMAAAQSMSPDSVRYLVKRGARLSDENNFGYGILQIAALRTSEPDVLRTLVEMGLDVNNHDSSGWTPLTQGVDNSEPAIARVLIELGADVNLAVQSNNRFNGTTPLVRAAGFARTAEVIQLLLDAGANVNVKDPDGKTVEQLMRENSFLTPAQRNRLLKAVNSKK